MFLVHTYSGDVCAASHNFPGTEIPFPELRVLERFCGGSIDSFPGLLGLWLLLGKPEWSNGKIVRA